MPKARKLVFGGPCVYRDGLYNPSEWRGRGSNPRHAAYEAAALTAELPRQVLHFYRSVSVPESSGVARWDQASAI